MDNDYNHSLPLPAFDRELDLEDLLSGIDRKKLMQSVCQLLGVPARLVSANGKLSLGEKLTTVYARTPVRSEIEAVAYLEVSTNAGKRLAAAGNMLEMLLRSTARYLMASDLHLEAVQSDYEELVSKHAALMKSERKYKELAEHLEQRVAEQVKIIEDAQRQLYQAEKMASVGQLAAGIAHEINNPMGFINSNLAIASDYVETISGFTEQLRQSVASEEFESIWKEVDLDFVLEDFKTLLQESINGAERVTTIVKDLKDFSNIDRVDEEIADINTVIRSACNIARNELGTDIELELAELPSTRCQPGHLGQAWLNLLRNAAQAINGKGRITIQTSSKDGRIMVRISDTGVGMSEDVMNRAFEPFFTSREVGQGTGLGLTVSRDIIQAHGGDIKIESKEGQGTTVSLWLPVVTQINSAT
jgi:signal transduction histidine kinase